MDGTTLSPETWPVRMLDGAASRLDARDIRVEHLTPGGDRLEDAEWDQAVHASCHGSPFHVTAWRKVVEEVFGLQPHYLMARSEGRLVGVLPLFEIRTRIVQRALLSVPYAVYGGIAADSEPARHALLAAARELGIRLGARYVEFRHTRETAVDLPTKSLYVHFVKPLADDVDVNFQRIPGKQRRMVRQGIKQGLEGRHGWTHLGEFYEVFAQSYRRLGSPVYPIRLFEMIRDHFGAASQLLTIWHEGRVVAGVISFFYKDRVMPYYGGALREAFAQAANDFMYWELMRDACVAGYGVFDFGRSREGTGAYEFKRHWGFEPQPLAYQYILAGGSSIPDVSPSNPRLRPLIEVWKRLPLPVTKWVGPVLTRWVP
jgi:FemAB-related protein (PEP-CTERM system-associated)